ncbi:MAG: SRPBCC family protein [Egibacteraceae bacterium]
MKLEHSFTVPVPVEEAWAVLRDVERIAPCMPGATIDAVDGDEFSGRVKVKVGPMTVTYKGNARFADVDEQGHRATIEASGKEARGSGTARATITAELTASGEHTDVALTTDLTITGKPAQFGRGVMADVGGKLVNQFADCLSSELARTEQPTEGAQDGATEVGGTEPPVRASQGQDKAAAARPSPEAIDLFDVAGSSVGKRLAPVVAALAVVGLVVWYLRRRSS